MTDTRKVNDLTAEEYFSLIRNAVAHGIHDQMGPTIAEAPKWTAYLSEGPAWTAHLTEINRKGVRARGGIFSSVLFALILWSALPGLLLLLAVVFGISLGR